MLKTKPTTKEDIAKYTLEIKRVYDLLASLLKLQNNLIGTIAVTFSSDFKEFFNSSEYMKISSDQFKNGQFDIVKLLNNLSDLEKNIQPAVDNIHFDDLEKKEY